MICDKGAKLADFSSSVYFDSARDKNFRHSTTLNFMSPRILLNGTSNEEVDIWQLGCLLGCLARNHTAMFYGSTFQEVGGMIARFLENKKNILNEISWHKELGNGVSLLNELLDWYPKITAAQILEHEFVIN